MITVYLANKTIKVVNGTSDGKRVNVEDAYLTIDSEASLFNGVITDEEIFKGLISKMWAEYNLPKKDVHLVIDTNQFNTKLIEVPKLNQIETLKFIKREFKDIERIQNPIYGYFPLRGIKNKNKLINMMVTVAPEDFVRKYIDVFSELDISVVGVHSARGAAVRLAENNTQVLKCDCLIQMVDDVSVTNLLFSKGAYIYSTKNRMFADPGSDQYVIEISRHAGNIFQFAKANDIPVNVTDVFVTGIEADDFELYADSISRIDENLSVDFLKPGTEIKTKGSVTPVDAIKGFPMAVGGLFPVDKKTNLFSSLHKKTEKAIENNNIIKLYLPVLIAAAVMALFSMGVSVYNSGSQAALDEVAMANAAINERMGVFDSIEQESKTYTVLSQSVNELKNTVLEYPAVNSETEDVLAKCAEGLVTAEIISYDSETGVLNLNTSASDVEKINQFVEAVKNEEAFLDVNYSGYTQLSDGSWTVKLICTMSPRENGVSDEVTNAND